jgi:hypothetical protein
MTSPPVPVPVAPVIPSHPNTPFPHNGAAATPAENFQIVTTFLNQKEGRPLSPVEADGIVFLIHNSTEREYQVGLLDTLCCMLSSYCIQRKKMKDRNVSDSQAHLHLLLVDAPPLARPRLLLLARC